MHAKTKKDIHQRIQDHCKMERKRWSDNLRNFLINATTKETKEDDQRRKVKFRVIVGGKKFILCKRAIFYVFISILEKHQKLRK